jgi:hypothetical protein
LAQFKRFKFTLVLSDPETSQREANAMAAEVEKQCPVGAALGLKGRGEGIVFAANGEAGRSWMSMAFKAKGASFLDTPDVKDGKAQAETKQKQDALAEFVTRAASVVRFGKAREALLERKAGKASAPGGPPAMPSLGWPDLQAFLVWVTDDILTEEKHELSELGATSRKDIKPFVDKVGKPWFKTNVIDTSWQ